MNTNYAVTTTYYNNSNVEIFDTLTEAIEYANGKACGLDSHSTITLEKYEFEDEILATNDRVDSGKSRNAWQNYFVNVGKIGFTNEYDEFEELEPTESQEIAGYECSLVYIVGDEQFNEYEDREATEYAEQNDLKIVEKYSDGCELYDTEEELHDANDCYNYIY